MRIGIWIGIRILQPMIVKRVGTPFIAMLVFVLGGCTEGSGAKPQYMEPEGSIGAQPPSLIEDRLALESGLKKIVYHVGPVDVPRGMKADEMLEKPLVMRFQTDEPVWVVGFSPRVVDINGGELPSDLLHLAIVSNVHEENPLCSDAGGGNPFVVATSMLTEISLPQGYGYPVLQTDPLEARVVLKNDLDDDYVDVFFELMLLVRPMSEMASLKDVKPLMIELDPCGHETVSIAPGKFAEHSAAYSMPEDASLIVAHGVLEDFGSSVELTAGEEAEPFWRAEAKLDENHRIVELIGNPFEDPSGIAFKEGDAITLNVAYDNPSDAWIDSATAAAIVYVAPSE